jgi:hypothetical protein
MPFLLLKFFTKMCQTLKRFSVSATYTFFAAHLAPFSSLFHTFWLTYSLYAAQKIANYENYKFISLNYIIT